MKNNHCNKYESLFVFSDENALKKHIEECDECRLEHEKMQKVSSLLDEVKMYYHAKRKNTINRLRIACVFAFILVSVSSAGLVAINEDFTETLMYGDTLSAEDLGFPVDSYGLLMVGE